jgi:hypothetical protein
MLIVLIGDGVAVLAETVLLTEAEYEAEMREVGSRRFVQRTCCMEQVYERPVLRDLERTPELDAMFGRFPSVQDIPRL